VSTIIVKRSVKVRGEYRPERQISDGGFKYQGKKARHAESAGYTDKNKT